MVADQRTPSGAAHPVWDGEGAIGRWRSGRVERIGKCQAFRGFPGAKVVVLKPADPEHKGIIERAHDYLERSFLPGRTFSGPGDFNHQLQKWLQIVDGRTGRVLDCAPPDRTHVTGCVTASRLDRHQAAVVEHLG